MSLRSIASGERGTDQTVDALKQLVVDSERRPEIRLLAIDILKSARVPNNDDAAAAAALFEWVRSNVHFYKDPLSIEAIQEPEFTVFELHAGDCDDHAALMAALARAVGIPARFIVVGQTPDRFQHIYPEVEIDGSWIAVDTTGGAQFGERPPDIGAKKIYEFSDKDGLGMTQQMMVDRNAVAAELRNVARTLLMKGWNDGQIDETDLRNYLKAIDRGVVEYAGNTFAVPLMKAVVTDFLAYVKNNGLMSRKRLREGLSGLDGFFGDLWNGVKKVGGTIISAAPAAAVGFATGGPAGAIVGAGTKIIAGSGGGTPTYVPGDQGQTVSIPIGDGTVTYTTGQAPAQPTTTQPVYTQPTAAPSGNGLLSNPLVLLGGSALLFLLLLKR